MVADRRVDLWGSNKERGGATGYGATDIWKMRPGRHGRGKIVDGADPTDNSWSARTCSRAAASRPSPSRRSRSASPEARVAAASGVEGAEITLDASGSKPGADDAAITTYEWDLDGDGVYTDAEGVAPKTTFPDEGTYTVSVLVTDAKGEPATATAEVTVTNAGPTITEARVDDGEPASFSARSPIRARPTSRPRRCSGTGEPARRAGDRRRRRPSDRGPAGPAATSAQARRHRRRRRRGRGAGDTRRGCPPNALPSARQTRRRRCVAGEAVDIDLPARDPEGEPLEYEIVDAPAKGSVQLRDRVAGADARRTSRTSPARRTARSRSPTA